MRSIGDARSRSAHTLRMLEQGNEHHAAIGTKAGPIARRQFRARLHQACRGLLPGALWRYPCAVHGHARGEGAALAEGRSARAGSRPNTACCRAPPASACGARRRPASNRAAPRKSSAWSAARLRAVVDLVALGESQITLDCDVIQADGGTRTAAITGSWVALHDCLKWMEARAMFKTWPLKDHVAAISCGIHGDERGARSRLCGGFNRRHRCKFRDDGFGRHRRNPGHGGGRALLARRACLNCWRWPARASASWWPCRRRRLHDAAR